MYMSFLNGLQRRIAQHKILTAFLVIIIVGGGYYWHSKSATTTAQTRYLLGQATTGTLVTSVDGTGQVSAVSQVDVKPKVSAQIIKLLVSEGQQVSAGTALAYLDSTDAQKAVRDAQV